MTAATTARGVEVLARWTARPPTRTVAPCVECGTVVELGQACPQCRQLAIEAPVGLIAVAHATPVGRRIVIAERLAGGRWAPVRTFAATPKAERMLRRQDGLNTGPAVLRAAGGACGAAGGGAGGGDARRPRRRCGLDRWGGRCPPARRSTRAGWTGAPA